MKQNPKTNSGAQQKKPCPSVFFPIRSQNKRCKSSWLYIKTAKEPPPPEEKKASP